PGAQHTLIDQGRPPQSAGDPAAFQRQAIDLAGVDVRDRTWREGDDAMIHLLEHGDVEIAEMAGAEESDDLPRPGGEYLVPSRPATEHQVKVLRPPPVRNDVLPRRTIADVPAKVRKAPLIAFAQ